MNRPPLWLLLVVASALTVKAAAVTSAVVENWDLLTEPAWWAQLGHSQLSTNLGLLLILLGLISLLPTRIALGWLVALDLVISLALIADVVHIYFYGDAASVSEIPNLRFLISIGPAMRPGLGWSLLWYLAEFPLVVWATSASWSRPPAAFSCRARPALAVAIAGLVLVVPAATRLSSVRSSMISGAVVPVVAIASIGILPYHTLDLVYSGSQRGPTTPSVLEDVRSFLDDHGSPSRSPLFGQAHGRNLIIISAESLQTFVIGLHVGGRPVAPNLTRLAAESLYFRRFQDETFLGTTSDAELAVLQSLHPIPDGVVALKYVDNRYHALPHILAKSGYSTLSAAAAPSWFWGRADMHPRLGFQTSLFENSFKAGVRVGSWLSDGDFFDQLLPILSNHPAPYAAFLVGSSNHSPYELPEGLRTFDVGEYRGTILGHYLETVHYFDTALGEFIEGLRASGVLDRSLLVVYGDHQAFLGETVELARLMGLDGVAGHRYEVWRSRKLVPLLIRMPFGASAGERPSVGGQVDVPVTILSLLGIEDRGVMLGRDLTDGQPGLAVFRDGSFAFGDYHYVRGLGPTAEPRCFNARNAAPVDCNPLREIAQEAIGRLRASDLILRHNLIPWARGESTGLGF